MQNLVLLLALVAVGCASLPPRALKFTAQKFNPKTVKYILIAGGHDNANYAQEVLDLKKHWLSQGVKENEISCYYAMPCSHSLGEDQQHFYKIADEISKCHPASMSLIEKHMTAISKQKPDFVFFYTSGHGSGPLEVVNKLEGLSEADKNEMKNRYEMYPQLNQYHLLLDSTEKGVSFHSRHELHEKLDKNIPLENLYMTADGLHKVLKKFPETTSKYIVLQGCYSGGFLENNRFSDIKKLTVLTASDATHTSFGCSPGTDRTFFGQAFLDSLTDTKGYPTTLDWKKLSTVVLEKVKNIESYYGAGTSNPLLFSTVPASSTLLAE